MKHKILEIALFCTKCRKLDCFMLIFDKFLFGLCYGEPIYFFHCKRIIFRFQSQNFLFLFYEISKKKSAKKWYLEKHLYCEDAGEDVVEVCEKLIALTLLINRIFSCQGYRAADNDDHDEGIKERIGYNSMDTNTEPDKSADLTIVKGTVSVISSDPPARMAVPDSQRYPSTLFLIKYESDA